MRLWLREWVPVIAFLVAMGLLGLVLFVVLGPMKVHDGVVTAVATAVIGVFTFTLAHG